MTQVQTTKRHYKMYKKGRFWVIAGITVATMGLTQVVGQADTNESANNSIDTTVTSGQSTGSAVPLKTTGTPKVESESLTTTGKVETKNQGDSEQPVKPAVSDAQPDEKTSAEPETPAQSGTSDAQNNEKPATGAGQELNQNNELTSDAAAPADKDAAQPTAPNQKKALRDAPGAPADDDQDLSDQFEDPTLLAAVRKGMSLKDDQLLTKAAIKAYGHGYGQSLNVTTSVNGTVQPVTSLKGLETLADLPSRVSVNFQVAIGASYKEMPNFDFTPLKAVTLRGLTLETPYWGAATDEQLRTIADLDPHYIYDLDFGSSKSMSINPYGMNNHQFAILAPFVQAVLENDYPQSNPVASFAGNSITDFSPLNTLSAHKGGRVTGFLQYAWNKQAVSYRQGDTVVVTSPIKGIHGESINYQVRYYQADGTASGTLVVADANQVAQKQADGTTATVWQYTLVNPQLFQGQLVYGQFYLSDGSYTTYPTDLNGQSMNGFDLLAGALVFQPVTQSKAQISFDPSEVVMGPNATWNYLDHLASVSDYDGNAIDTSEWANLKITNVNNGPDLTQAGQQTVTFAYTDDQGVVHSATAIVNVLASQATITAKDDQVVWPQDVSKLTAADLVQSVTDASGKATTDFTGVTMTPINAAQAGAQTVTLTYTDAVGNPVTATMTVTVDLASLTTKPTQVIAGPNAKWDYLSDVDSATDSTGQSIDSKNADVQVVTGPDLSDAMIGQPQTIVLAYTDNLGRTQQFTAVVTTVKTKAVVSGVQNVTIIAGPKASWTLNDSIDWQKTFAADGTQLSAANLNQITATGTPNVQKPGTYTLTLRYVDAAGNLATDTATVNVVASQATLKVADSQLKVGDTWQPGDNLVQVTDATGQPLTVSAVTVSGTVDTSVAGTYPVTYTYTDIVGNVYTQTAVVTVVEAGKPDQPGDGGGTTTDPGNGGGTTTDPGDGGGTTTDPGDGGGTTTDPGDGGGTTTDPDNGGGTTTDPDNGGGTTTNPGDGDGITTDPGNGDGITDPDDGGNAVDSGNNNSTTDSGNGDTITEPGTSDTVKPGNNGETSQPTAPIEAQKQVAPVKTARPARTLTSTSQADHTVAPAQAKATALPQTDERATGLAGILVGVLGLTGLLAGLGASHRRHED
ncbi:bacterial Ig-like domain-containing protein [Lactiplantibacillus xiangfangensis]|uniref:bacterial Ig-like domain-containing protein n=1 Tax=Lactiplantibacillus xiangfangensis TaxID=942150 RepID=UPI0007109FDB|nr:bacterial Ig-like domain-containing protein [Lactiplantibacillus xiangfangensis]